MPAVNDYELNIDHALRVIRGSTCKLIHVQIKNKNGTFSHRALEEFIEVTNGNLVERPYQLRISFNQKELNALFAIDAFNAFTGNVQVRFGYLGEYYKFFDNVTITAINALSPDLATIPATQATKSWLGI